ncbi:MAG: gamma-glutamylcyclotransferase, partial [Desulfobacterales bacterium]
QFPFWSEKSQAGYSGIMEAPGELVHGALYEVTEQELIALDDLEGVYKDLYKRWTFLILGEDGKFHHADLYRVIDPKGPFPPCRSYVEIMLSGARDLGLDSAYIRKIEGFYHQGQ